MARSVDDKLSHSAYCIYTGFRIRVIDNRSRFFGEDYDIVVWDKALECAVGFCSQSQDGSFAGFVAYGPHELPIAGADARELAQDALKSVNWALKH
jgi:hypothetical protein